MVHDLILYTVYAVLDNNMNFPDTPRSNEHLIQSCCENLSTVSSRVYVYLASPVS